MKEQRTGFLCDNIRRLLSDHAISQSDAKRYLGNYAFFKFTRKTIVNGRTHTWVAALNGALYTNDTLKGLQEEIKDKNGSEYAYIEKVANPQSRG